MSVFSSRFTSSIAVALLLSVTQPLFAGSWHYGASLVCSDCHTQHNSANGQPMRTDNDPKPAPMLLRRGTPLELCLSCHDGSNPAAPDVVAPVSYVSEAAGGAFPNGGGLPVDPGASYSHHLNTPTAVVPPGGSQSMVLICTTCHDPHGNENYRNLRPDPSKTNQSPVIVLAAERTTADGSNPTQVYVPSNVVYKAGVSAWCMTCHTTPPYPHSIDVAIWGAASASYPAWTSTTTPRVPVLSPTDGTIPSQDDRVMCLSCHKAHGSNNPKALLYADGTTLDSTCQECHNQ